MKEKPWRSPALKNEGIIDKEEQEKHLKRSIANSPTKGHLIKQDNTAQPAGKRTNDTFGGIPLEDIYEDEKDLARVNANEKLSAKRKKEDPADEEAIGTEGYNEKQEAELNEEIDPYELIDEEENTEINERLQKEKITEVKKQRKQQMIDSKRKIIQTIQEEKSGSNPKLKTLEITPKNENQIYRKKDLNYMEKLLIKFKIKKDKNINKAA